MRADIRDGFALLADIVEPRGPDERFAGDFLEEVVDAFHHDRGLLGGALLERAEKLGHAGQLALEDAGDLVALGHDVVEQDLVGGGAVEGLAEQFEVGRRDGHGLVGQHVEAGGDGAVDVFGLAGVVAGQHHDVAGLFLQHPFEEIRAGIDFLLPVRGLVSAGVEALDALEVLLQVRACRRIDVHDRADLRIHELLDQAGVEVAGVEGDEADPLVAAAAERVAHMARRREGEIRGPKPNRKPNAEAGR